MKDMNKTGLASKLGDAIERVGEKLTRAGSKKVGKKIYEAGDRLEHKNDVVKDLPITDVK